jgi:hypothetical protein
MPLNKLQFRPGINREGTTLSNEGGWFAMDKVRFQSGYPEKLGGWQRDSTSTTTGPVPTTGSFLGICRSMWNWITLAGANLLTVGTNQKYYIQFTSGGTLHDVSPIRLTTAAGVATFAATTGSTSLVVTSVAHGAAGGDYVTFTAATSLGGVITAAVLNVEWRITTVTTVDTFTLVAPIAANASDTANGGAATVASFQYNTWLEDWINNNLGWSGGRWGGVNRFGVGVTGWGAPSADVEQSGLWSQANFGQDLIMCSRNNELFYWAVNVDPSVFDRAVLMTGGGTPVKAAFVTVSALSRFVVAFGCNEIATPTIRDPLLIRWSDQESYTQWTPDVTNQAGGIKVSNGSYLVTQIQTRREILVWSDSALFSMQYVGPPYVFKLDILADNISIIGPNAVATANNTVYWMGFDKFYTYSGRTETLPCSLHNYVFDDINRTRGYKIVSGTNEGFDEVWWFYCSANAVENDRYVIYNYLERVWYYGNLDRTAWLDSPLREVPIAVTSGNVLVYHETGVDDATTTSPTAITSYIRSSDFDIGDGHNFGYVWRLIPDVTFNGSTSAAPTVTFTAFPRQNPGASYGPADNPDVVSVNNYSAQRTYEIQQFTQQVNIRIRGRQMAVQVGSDQIGTHWTLGVPRIDIRQDGRK